jgi:histidinol-phosphatase (PHP family)
LSGDLFTSLHTHTIFCDGKDDVETMCRVAHNKGLAAIGFSAHAPITKQTGIASDFNLSDDKVDEYVAEVLAAKRRWQGKLNVYLGYEVDYIKGLRSALDRDIKELALDFTIGSVHYIVHPNGAKPFTVDGLPEEFNGGLSEAFGGDARALMHYYYDAVAEMIAIGGFDILGHADLIKKNCQNKNYWPQEDEFQRQKEIAAAVSSAGLTVEVNTGGINRKKTSDVYPSLPFLRLLRQRNVPVMITADAHTANDLDGNYPTACQTLLDAGYTSHVVFEGRTGGKPLWREVALA